MITTKLATIAVLATVAAAAPTTAAPTTTEVRPFKFSQWVDDIINPDVEALTPEQAVEAYYQSVNATTSTQTGGTKAKRFSVQCYTSEYTRAEVNPAAMCVSSLAALGNGVTYSWSGYAKSVTLCNDIPNVELVAVSGTDGPKVATAQQLAIGGGHIMDACTWGGRTGGLAFEDFNPDIQIYLRRQI
ncbi:hypothetical protein B0T20DRAFT_490641 [Sordaria brevicollis]|uniref:Ecp2 effector protein domain-containing protein n=1 Tax=Sordaria brevicollis TaxID=83679 RepID=A0AAE0U2V6_SORBR|nr:hypothetical protein B0T20DRAFT_490641 [Sordaria brevicollis]